MKQPLIIFSAIFGLAFAASAQNVDTTKSVPHLTLIQTEPAVDTLPKGMTITYHCHSNRPPDTVITNYPGIVDITIYHCDEVEGPDTKVMQEMKIEGVEVKVEY